MRPPDDLDFGMHRFATTPESTVDDWTADRLLGGRLDPLDAPRELSEVARLVTAAKAPATVDELADQDAVVAAMVAAIAQPAPTGRAARSHRVAKLLTAKAAAITATTIIGITGAAAATGSLPAPAQSTVATALAHVGVEVPKPEPTPADDAPQAVSAARPRAHVRTTQPVATTDDASTPTEESTPSSVGVVKPVGPKPAGTSALGLCTAAGVRDDGGVPDSALNSVAFRDLKAAADGSKLDIPTFCKDARAGQPTTTATRTATSLDERSTTSTSSTSTTPASTTTTVKSDSTSSTTSSTTVSSTTTSTDNPDATTTSTSIKPRGTAHKPVPDTSPTTADTTQSQTTDTTAPAS